MPRAATAAAGPAAKPGQRFHVVLSGESLWSIAKDLLGKDASVAAVAREVNRLWELNKSRIGTGDPDLLIGEIEADAPMSSEPPQTLKRRDVYPRPVIDGRPARNGAAGRFRRQVQRRLVSQGEREEAELERRIYTQPGVTRPNTIALISPKGGVGKTTSTFVVGNLLASHLKLRAIAVDANPDFGTLARLAPDDRRSERSLADLLDDADRLNTAAELGAYVSRLATGLHVLGAPRDAELTATLGPDRYGELVAFLASFYEVVLLDLGTGVAGPLAHFAIERADQVVLVTTPEWVTSSVVLEALSHLQHDRTTVALNKSYLRSADLRMIDERFRAQHLHRAVTIPYDEQLATMLDSGTYTVDALKRPSRVAIKRLGLAVAEQLV